MSYETYKRAKMGWTHLKNITDLLGQMGFKEELIYVYDTNELVITNEVILKYLDHLKIPYEIKVPTNAVQFILDMKE